MNKTIHVQPPIIVQELAERMGISPYLLITIWRTCPFLPELTRASSQRWRWPFASSTGLLGHRIMSDEERPNDDKDFEERSTQSRIKFARKVAGTTQFPNYCIGGFSTTDEGSRVG
jgi:hypothetical protein